MSFIACVFCGAPAANDQAPDAICPACGGDFIEFEGEDGALEDITDSFEELDENDDVDEDVEYTEQYTMFEGYNWEEWN